MAPAWPWRGRYTEINLWVEQFVSYSGQLIRADLLLKAQQQSSSPPPTLTLTHSVVVWASSKNPAVGTHSTLHFQYDDKTKCCTQERHASDMCENMEKKLWKKEKWESAY